MNQEADIMLFIKWAFYKGYTLGINDAKEDIYIDPVALKKSFLKQVLPHSY